MKNNSKSVGSHILKVINQLFEHNGKKSIPHVKKICLKANINPATAIKYLYVWLEQYQASEFRRDLVYLCSTNQAQVNELEQAIGSLKCLAKELEIHSTVLNDLTYFSFPLGNHIIHSLQVIENKLFVTYSYVNELNDEKTRVEKQLNQALLENRRLIDEISEMQQVFFKKKEYLEEQLEAKKREVLAAHHLIKSLKREKRRPALKRLIYEHNLIAKPPGNSE
ncbi:hypothetical protein [Legionella sp.]|uniref:hypothetical protein n=1 Tax=Legionella sp. TaxID=459 RepID=UPI00321FB5A3